MNKIITNLIQIAYDIMKSEPNFIEIDKKLTQIEKELTFFLQDERLKTTRRVTTMIKLILKNLLFDFMNTSYVFL